MGLKTTKSAYLHTKDGTIVVTPQGGRKIIIRAAKHVKITDRHGKALTSRRKQA